MSLREDLRTHAVVAVNEYHPHGIAPTGHVNVSFYYHGIDQGTYGRNSAGIDLKGKPHPADLLHGAGGVFIEPIGGAMTHYVILSDSNYQMMLAYAMSQARLTASRPTSYGFLGNNCADFVWQVFQHSDLPPRYKSIPQYLSDKLEAVAIYAEADALQYEPKAVPLNR